MEASRAFVQRGSGPARWAAVLSSRGRPRGATLRDAHRAVLRKPSASSASASTTYAARRRAVRAIARPARPTVPTRPCTVCQAKATAETRVSNQEDATEAGPACAKSQECGIFVQFELPHETRFGQSHRIVGNFLELGGWEVENALCLEWSEGHVWKGCVVLAPSSGACEFKCVKVNSDGSVEWQKGGNRLFEVPGVDCDSVRVRCLWDSEDLSISMECRQGTEAVSEWTASDGSSDDESMELTELLETFAEGPEGPEDEGSRDEDRPFRAMKTSKLPQVAQALMRKKERKMNGYKKKSEISARKIEDLQNVLDDVRDSQRKLQDSLQGGDGQLNAAIFQQLSESGKSLEEERDTHVQLTATSKKWQKSKETLSNAIQKAATENQALFEQLRRSQRALELERALHRQHQMEWEQERAGFAASSTALQEDRLHALEEELKVAKDEAIELGDKLARAMQTLADERSEHREWAVKWEEERRSLHDTIRTEEEQSSAAVVFADSKVKELEDQIVVAEAMYQEELHLQLKGQEAEWEGMRTELEEKVTILQQSLEDTYASGGAGKDLRGEIEALETRLCKEQEAQMALSKMTEAFEIAKNALEADLDNTQSLVATLQETLRKRSGEAEEIEGQLVRIQQVLHKERAAAKASREERDQHVAHEQELEEQLKGFQEDLAIKSSEAADLAVQVSDATSRLERESQASHRLRESLQELAGRKNFRQAKLAELPGSGEEGLVLAIGTRLQEMEMALGDEDEKVQRLTDELCHQGQREQELLRQISQAESSVQAHAETVAELKSQVADLTTRLREEQARSKQLEEENGASQQMVRGLQEEAAVSARALASSEARAKDLQRRLKATEKDLLRQKSKSNALENGAAHWRQAEKELQAEYSRLKQDLALQLEDAEEQLENEADITAELRTKVGELNKALADEMKNSQKLQASAAEWVESERRRQKQLVAIQLSMLKSRKELEATLATSECELQEETARREQLEVHNAALAESEQRLKRSLAEHQRSIQHLEEKLSARAGEVKGLMMELVAAMAELSKHQIKLIPPSNPVTRKQLEALSKQDLKAAAKRAGLQGSTTSAVIIQQLLNLDSQSRGF